MTREQFISQVEGCQKSLRRFLTALCCGDSSLADDIAQESFIRAWLASNSFRGDAEFSTWIHRIAYNTFLNYSRKRIVATEIDTATKLETGDRADDAFKYQPLYMALAKLNARERTSITLFYMQGYSIKEIAQIENTTPDAVKQHLSRGRVHLKNLLTLQ